MDAGDSGQESAAVAHSHQPHFKREAIFIGPILGTDPWDHSLPVRNGSQVEDPAGGPSLQKWSPFASRNMVTIADCGLAQRMRRPYMARHRVSAERLGLAAIDAPD